MSGRNPSAILYDVSGNLAVIQSGFPATGTVTGSAPGVMVAGTDGQFARLLKTTVDGTLQVTGSTAISNTVPVTGSVDVAHLYGVDDPGNSSTAPLGNGGTFTGTAFDALNYSTFVCLIGTNKKSATNGIQFQWSNDGTNWDLVRASTMENDDEARGFHVSHQGRYFRIVYTNGNSPQGHFRLNVFHRPAGAGLITRPLIDTVDDDNFALLTRAVLAAKNN